MNKRIFIAINLPGEIKRILRSSEKRWKNLHVRWTSFENMHITVEFLGRVDRIGLEKILKAVEKSASETKPFSICLDRIVLGPNLIQPRMFWATVFIDHGIIGLKKSMETNLRSFGFELEKREFRPHITLARAKGNQLKGKQTNIPLEGLRFKTESIEVMQSNLYPGGSRYKVVESFKFRI